MQKFHYLLLFLQRIFAEDGIDCSGPCLMICIMTLIRLLSRRRQFIKHIFLISVSFITDNQFLAFQSGCGFAEGSLQQAQLFDQVCCI